MFDPFQTQQNLKNHQQIQGQYRLIDTKSLLQLIKKQPTQEEHRIDQSTYKSDSAFRKMVQSKIVEVGAIEGNKIQQQEWGKNQNNWNVEVATAKKQSRKQFDQNQEDTTSKFNGKLEQIIDVNQGYAGESRIKRKSSNPRFEINVDDQQRDGLIRNLQHFSKSKQKYGDVHYFRKKQRLTEIRDIQEIFKHYSDSPNRIEYQENNYKNTGQVPVQQYPGYQQIQKDCELCRISKTKHQTHKMKKNGVRPKIQPAEFWPTSSEPRAMKINQSPSRQISKRYLSSQYKTQYLNSSQQKKKQTIELRQDLLQKAGQLREEYLKMAKNRIKHKLQEELEHLKTYQCQKHQHRRQNSQRKKIFQGNQLIDHSNNIKIEDQENNEKEAYITPKKWKNQQKSSTINKVQNIFSLKRQKQLNQNQNKGYNFKYIRQTLAKSRNKIFSNSMAKTNQQWTKTNSNNKNKANYSTAYNSPRHTKYTPNFQHTKIGSPLKQHFNMFKLIGMKAQIQKWFEQNRKQIEQQTQKIMKYELIQTSITLIQIEQRLNHWVEAMINPKRWLLLMVDQVYARLKNRNFNN